MIWAIFSSDKQHIIDFFKGNSDDCWKYVQKHSYNCGMIGSMNEDVVDLWNDGWEYLDGMWIAPKS